MKYVSQLTIILGISFLGELCHSLIPAPIPASIYGMVLLFLFLITGIIKLRQVQDVGHFFIETMALFFVCPVVGLLKCRDIIAANFVSIAVITLVSLVLTFGVGGMVTQFLMDRSERKNPASSRVDAAGTADTPSAGTEKEV